MTYLMKMRIRHLLGVKVFLGVAIIYTIALTFISLVEKVSLSKINISFNDKIAHFLAYFILASLWTIYISFKLNKSSLKQVFLLIIPLGFFYGIIIEVLQKQITETRNADVFDAIANFIGLVVGVLLIWFLKQYFFKVKK